MLIVLVSYIAVAFFDLLTLICHSVSLAIPNWLMIGIADIFSGTAKLQFLLPMYPDPTLTGIAQVAGIMTVVAWLLLLIYAIWVLIIISWGVKLFISILPWSTHSVKTPAIE